MKYYSEITNKVYNTEKDLIAAENIVAKKEKEEEIKKAQRATRAKEVEDAFKAAGDAQAHANELLDAFTKDYGSFHMTMKGNAFPFHDSLLNYMLTRF